MFFIFYHLIANAISVNWHLLCCGIKICYIDILLDNANANKAKNRLRLPMHLAARVCVCVCSEYRPRVYLSTTACLHECLPWRNYLPYLRPQFSAHWDECKPG